MAGELLKVGGETVQRKFEYHVHSLSNMNSTTPAQDLSPTHNLSVGSSAAEQLTLVPPPINPTDTPHHGLIDSGLI